MVINFITKSVTEVWTVKASNGFVKISRVMNWSTVDWIGGLAWLNIWSGSNGIKDDFVEHFSDQFS